MAAIHIVGVELSADLSIRQVNVSVGLQVGSLLMALVKLAVVQDVQAICWTC